jgi:hypothetical protein
MRALSLKQPWANLILSGKKTIETRTWGTSYRGDIVICSSKNPKISPTGVALCVVELYDVRPMNMEDEEAACIKVFPKAHSWFIRNVRKIDPPIPVKGQLGLFELKINVKRG